MSEISNDVDRPFEILEQATGITDQAIAKRRLATDEAPLLAATAAASSGDLMVEVEGAEDGLSPSSGSSPFAASPNTPGCGS